MRYIIPKENKSQFFIGDVVRFTNGELSHFKTPKKVKTFSQYEYWLSTITDFYVIAYIFNHRWRDPEIECEINLIDSKLQPPIFEIKEV